MAYKKTLITADPMGIGTVLKRYRLSVPPNQRNYSWGDQVGALLRDYSEAMDATASYFVGTIVITSPEDSQLPEIADGQQRLATSMIVLAAIRDYFVTTGEEKLANSIENEFLFTLDRPTKDIVPMLLLNVVDREYFAKRVLSAPDSPDRTIAAKRPSHEKIDKAANAAADHIKQAVAGKKPQHAVERLNDLTDFIQNYANVILVTAPDHLSAYVMFETLNDRGLDTSQVDLLKNHLFRLTEKRVDEAQHSWTTAMNTLEAVDVSPLTYLRYLAIMLYGPTQEKALMQRVKEKVTSKQRAIEFLDQLNDNAASFVSIYSPEHVSAKRYGTTARKHLGTLRDEFKVEQIMPLVMAVASRFSIKEAQKAFRMFVCWSVRFLVMGGRGGFFDKHYSEKAHMVGTGEIKTAAELADKMIKDLVIAPDGAFEQEFANATVPRNRLARYYLRALELQYKGDSEPELIPNPSEEQITLEHILPQNPSSDWKIEEEIAVGWFRKLGNLVLLQASVNVEAGNGAFKQKRKHYKQSAFYLTSMVAGENSWAPDQIRKRQDQLAKLAVKTWPMR
ncbi:MAG: DUF262 domain-containing protein [Gemmataceae bacterium]